MVLSSSTSFTAAATMSANITVPQHYNMKASTTRIAVTGYKNSRKSHVGIHLWEVPPTSSKKRKQVMIVHIDDHSIFASSATTATNESTKRAQHHDSTPVATLKVGMKLISVNGKEIRQQHSIQDVYAMLQNAVGFVTLILGTPSITSSNTESKSELPTGMDKLFNEKLSDYTSWMQLQHDYNHIPEMEPLSTSDESGTSSASSSFSSTSSLPLTPWNTVKQSDSDDDDDDCDDEDDDDESMINNVYALENRIRNIWSPLLTNGSGRISNRQRQR